MSGDALCRAAQPAHIRERPGPESGARPASHRPGLNLSETQDAPPALIFHMAALRSAAGREREAMRGVQRDLLEQRSRTALVEKQHAAAVSEAQSLRQRIVGLVRSS